MAAKILQLNTLGQKIEVEGLVVSTGASDSGKVPALNPQGEIDSSMLPAGIGIYTKDILATESLNAGDIVNVFDSGGVRVQKADAATSKQATGYVLTSVLSGNIATVYFSGTITGLSTLTPGVIYFLGTAGVIVSMPPSASGVLLHRLGTALSATELAFAPVQTITRV